ncbi:MAG: ATP-binding domain-containing protein [Deltaproteobacteria bacterium]|nr:ATP-binding domain-containing protein [Deltaproteobacteria bacterium]
MAKVLDLANAVIEANPDRHPKSLLATREQGPTVRLVVSEDGEKEAAWVGDLIRDRVDAGDCRLDGVAILYRSNKLARAFEAALRARDLSYRVLGGRSFFDRKEVKDLLAYLRLAMHPVDSLSLRRIINVPARGIGAQTVAKLAAWAEQRNLPVSKAVEQASQVLGEGDRVLPAVRRFSELMVGHRKSLRKGPLVGAVRSLLDQIGLHQSVIKSSNTGDAAEKRWAGVEDFLIGLEGYEKTATKPSLREYLHHLSLNELDGDKDKDDEGRGLITLSSLHGAKGLEFSLVFLVGAEEGYLPHARVMNPSISDVDVGDLAEERRLCYVGITRAKDELIITRAANRVVRGKARERVVSRYLADLDESLLEVEDQTAPVDESTAMEHLSRIRAMLSK